MNKIKIGYYAKTKYGCIYKIADISEDKYIVYEKDEKYGYKGHFSKDIYKIAENIIDLIQIRRLC